jgi:hypothetical protein
MGHPLQETWMSEEGVSPPAEGASGEPVIVLDSRSIGTGRQAGAGVVTEKHLLFFGSNVLLVLTLLMCAAGATYFFSDKDHLQTGKDIFEFAKATLPPIATLILGFYFRGARGPH